MLNSETGLLILQRLHALVDAGVLPLAFSLAFASRTSRCWRRPPHRAQAIQAPGQSAARGAGLRMADAAECLDGHCRLVEIAERDVVDGADAIGTAFQGGGARHGSAFHRVLVEVIPISELHRKTVDPEPMVGIRPRCNSYCPAPAPPP